MNTPRLPSTQYSFSTVPDVNIPRSSLRRPGTYKTTINAGLLYPVYIDEILPGDTFILDQSSIARLTTPIVPFMDNLYLDFQFFFVPNRLVWNHWVNMMGEQVDPGDSVNYTVPYVSSATPAVGTLADYFGIPTGVKFGDKDVSALPFRAYNLIWNEWYRDENLQDSVTVKKDDTADTLGNYTLLPRGKRKDYFTSCLPWPQKGDAINIPMSGSAPVIGNGNALGLTPSPNAVTAYMLGCQSDGYLVPSNSTNVLVPGATFTKSTSIKSETLGVSQNPEKSGLIADLSAVNATSINVLREAFALQRLLERNARGGTRYVELLKSLFGVTSPDARLQRPELLGSFTLPIQLHTVPQSSGSEEEGDVKTPQGNLSAFGMATGTRRAFAKSFVEHGYVIGLASVRADLTYQQGLRRMWSRQTRYDFYCPPLAHLGEQAVLNKEIYLSGASVVDSNGERVDNQAFGYNERWSEYKYGVNMITGELRSTYAQSLDVWHLAQKFDNLPTLNDTFIRENPPLSRVLAVTDAPQFLLDIYYNLRSVRPIPLYCVPGLIDHF
nr:MAG: major capsid protein [Microviridae sp.]